MFTEKTILKEQNDIILEEVVLKRHEGLKAWVVKNKIDRHAARTFDNLKAAEKYFRTITVPENVTQIIIKKDSEKPTEQLSEKVAKKIKKKASKKN
jgi:hypothetical protein